MSRATAPRTAAQIRAAEVKAARGPKTVRPAPQPPPWERDEWVDEGPLREVADDAARRARGGDDAPRVSTVRRRRATGTLDPEVTADVARQAGPRAARYQERLLSAAQALERGRFDDARRMVQPVLRDLPGVAMAHEIAGLALYSTGQWRKAAAELEIARELDGSVRHHAVLADCYRAMRRYPAVESLWEELKAASPAPALMAEGRIVAAGSLADQGDLKGALALLERAATVPAKVRDHHLRQWYVIADLQDRAGNVVEARRMFAQVSRFDPDFADVAQRLAGLGR